MVIFKTERLRIQTLEEKDRSNFIELLTNPKIVDPSPEQKIDAKEIERKFKTNLKLKKIPNKGIDNIWGVFEVGKNEMIGLGAILSNELNDWELGYRLMVKSWGKGYGTELAKGLIDYSLLNLSFDKITADVDISNKASVKILEKYMNLEKEFYNSEDKCIDRRYEIRKENWL